MKAIVIAGASSGVGKTTVALGLMGALVNRGYRVQPFKVGPDYIDPSYHTTMCGLPCRNLDSWLLDAATIQELFYKAMTGKDIAIIEGVMGLYDGANGEDEEGSTAQLAKLLGLPVILVIDASKSSRSVGALALGFKAFDPELNLSGIILNGLAGEMHLALARPSLTVANIPFLGYLPGQADLQLPERHLGLIPTAEGTVAQAFYQKLTAQCEVSLDINRIISIAANTTFSIPKPTGLFPETSLSASVSIAVAMDKAFNFYYPDSLDLLEAWGAEIIPFSPLADSALPKGIGGVYLGGGFPELFASELSENSGMRRAFYKAAEDELPIYAECGGLMYLGQGMEDLGGQYYPMVGVIPGQSIMKDSHLTLGYRTVQAITDNPLLAAGESVRGHEFHWSSFQAKSETPATSAKRIGQSPYAYKVLEQNQKLEGFRFKNVLASYIHLHLGSKKSLAPRFVQSCIRWASM